MEIQQGLMGRHVRAEQLHLTLKFYGEVPLDADLIARLEGVKGLAPGAQTLDRWVAFPHPRRATVLAVGAARAVPELQALYEFLGPEERGFKPHITLSRLRLPAGIPESFLPPLELRFDRLTLYRSHLGSGGSRYEILQEFPLAAV